MARFTGKTIFVTGATSGIGKDTVLALAEQGANIAFTGRREALGKELEGAVNAKGGTGLFIKADASNEDETKGAVARTVERFGGLDGAFNNAGIEGDLGPIVEAGLDNYRKIFDINVWGVLNSMKHEIPAMIGSGGGSIVNTSSIAGQIGFPGAGVYVGSKHAVNGLTRTAALEVAQQGVRINAVSPAAVQTDMIDRFAGDEQTREYMTGLHPIGRFGQPREITSLVLWLLSDEASFITGQAIVADGGFTAQ